LIILVFNANTDPNDKEKTPMLFRSAVSAQKDENNVRIHAFIFGHNEISFRNPTLTSFNVGKV
jgi:hypothetical protein